MYELTIAENLCLNIVIFSGTLDLSLSGRIGLRAIVYYLTTTGLLHIQPKSFNYYFFYAENPIAPLSVSVLAVILGIILVVREVITHCKTQQF